MPEHGVELQNRDPADLTLEVVAEAEQGDVLESLQPIGCPAGEKVESMRSMFRSPTFADSAMEQLHTPLVIVPATWEARPGAELNRRLRLGGCQPPLTHQANHLLFLPCCLPRLWEKGSA